MKKKTGYKEFIFPVAITALTTTAVCFSAVYVFHIPIGGSSSLSTPVAENQKPDWTPRKNDTPIAPVLPENTGSKQETKACTMEYAPVCGKDGHNYSNSCLASTNGVEVDHAGNCESKKIEITPTLPPSEVISGEGKAFVFDSGSYHLYSNTNGYSIALPKYAWYQGLGAQNGAVHALAIGLSETGAQDTNADIVLYFYKKTPSTPPEGQEIVTKNGSLYLVVHASGPKIDKIIQTIRASVE